MKFITGLFNPFSSGNISSNKVKYAISGVLLATAGYNCYKIFKQYYSKSYVDINKGIEQELDVDVVEEQDKLEKVLELELEQEQEQLK